MKTSIPRHIAIIMDGNGRWAKARLLPRTIGHKAAVSRVREIINSCINLGIEVLTLYAFSSENWARPEDEVSVLMGLYLYYLRNEMHRWHRQQVKLRVIGERTMLSKPLQQVMAEAEALTMHNRGLQLNLAINYGGRAEILQAFNAWCQGHPSQELTEENFEALLYTHGQPAPDLMIRTSGVSRISNFLIWQLAYAELYFTEVFFPDFDREQFSRALAWYAEQPRRFGKIDEQLTN